MGANFCPDVHVENPSFFAFHRLDLKMFTNGIKDVTSQEFILKIDQAFHEALPLIGSVVNGAILLNENLLMNILFEELRRKLMPKAKGSVLLNKLYSHSGLDFFILIGTLRWCSTRCNFNPRRVNVKLLRFSKLRSLRNSAASSGC